MPFSLIADNTCISVPDAASIFTVSTEMAKLEFGKEAAHTEFISNHSPEKRIHCQVFIYEELYAATEGFRADRFLGEGGFGKVYKGVLDGTNQVDSCASAQFNSCSHVLCTKIRRYFVANVLFA